MLPTTRNLPPAQKTHVVEKNKCVLHAYVILYCPTHHDLYPLPRIYCEWSCVAKLYNYQAFHPGEPTLRKYHQHLYPPSLTAVHQPPSRISDSWYLPHTKGGGFLYSQGLTNLWAQLSAISALKPPWDLPSHLIKSQSHLSSAFICCICIFFPAELIPRGAVVLKPQSRIRPGASPEAAAGVEKGTGPSSAPCDPSTDTTHPSWSNLAAFCLKKG